jgi:hypothetical protein
MVYFQTENPIFGNFLRTLCRSENVDIFYGHLEYFKDIWEIFWPFGTFFPVLVSRTKKNLAILVSSRNHIKWRHSCIHWCVAEISNFLPKKKNVYETCVNIISCGDQGCQMVYFHTQNPNLGRYILEGLGMENVWTCYGHLEHLEHLVHIGIL